MVRCIYTLYSYVTVDNHTVFVKLEGKCTIRDYTRREEKCKCIIGSDPMGMDVVLDFVTHYIWDLK